jgi:hypothetical protein
VEHRVVCSRTVVVGVSSSRTVVVESSAQFVAAHKMTYAQLYKIEAYAQFNHRKMTYALFK